MNMEQYKAKLKLGQRITAAAAVLLMIFSVFFALGERGVVNITPIAGDSHWQSQWRGFVSGASAGVAALMLFYLIRTARALRNEETLRKLYIKENDERQIQIWTSARALATQIFLLGGLAVGIIAGYFSMTVSVTVLGCTVAHSLIAAACELYYSRKY